MPPPEHYEPETLGFAPKTTFFRSLGGGRLDFLSLAPFMREASAATGLPVELIDAVVRTESGYRPEPCPTAAPRVDATDAQNRQRHGGRRSV